MRPDLQLGQSRGKIILFLTVMINLDALKVKNREICVIYVTNCFESMCAFTDVPASIYDRKTNILRSLSLVQSLLKGRNATIWRIGHREVKLEIYFLKQENLSQTTRAQIYFAPAFSSLLNKIFDPDLNTLWLKRLEPNCLKEVKKELSLGHPIFGQGFQVGPYVHLTPGTISRWIPRQFLAQKRLFAPHRFLNKPVNPINSC